MGISIYWLLKCSEILRIKTYSKELRICHYGRKLLLICLKRVCFPAIITKVCHENEHLPVFSEAPSSQEVILVTFGETPFSLLMRHNGPIHDSCTHEKSTIVLSAPVPAFPWPLCFSFWVLNDLKLSSWVLMLCNFICTKRQVYLPTNFFHLNE